MHRRKGYILLAVLGIAVIVTALGLSFVESHSTAMPESVNRYGAMRALYLAESGVAIGTHFLMYPPTTVAYGSYYTGASNVAVDATSDYTNISVLRSDAWTPAKTDLNLYRITATGVALDPDGSVRGKRQVTAEVIVPEANKWVVPYALFDTTSSTIPLGVSIFGDFHANGDITGNLFSFCNGTISATGDIDWRGIRDITKPLAPSSAPYVGPTAATNKYESYTIRGQTYTALVITDNNISSADAAALNATTLTAANPGRIMVYKGGNLIINSNANLLGTLVVTAGNLEFENGGPIQITAVEGFPAAVVAGATNFVMVRSHDTDVTINGSIISAGGWDIKNKKNSTIRVVGSVIKSKPITGLGSGTSVRFTWDSTRSWFWDVENAPPSQPYTLLNWKED